MFRGRGSGRGQRGGGRSGYGGGRTCRFFASAAGCSKGASCSFSHDSNGGGKKRSQPTNSPPSAGPPQQHQQNKQQKKKQEKRKSKRKNNNSGGSSGGSGGRGCRGSASTTNDDDSESGHTVPQIPGFYYDYEKEKYFALAPGQKKPPPPLRKRSGEEDEQQRQPPFSASASLAVGRCRGGLAVSMALVLQQRQRHRGVPRWRSLHPVLQSMQQVYNWRAPALSHAGAQNQITALYVNPHADILTMLTENNTVCHMDVVPDPSRSGRPMLLNFDERPTRSATTITALRWSKMDAVSLDVCAYTTLGAAANPGTAVIFKKPRPGAPPQQRIQLMLPKGNAWTVEWSRNAFGWLAIGSDNSILLRDLNNNQHYTVPSIPSAVLALEFLPGSTSGTLAAGSRDGYVRLFDVRKQARLRGDGVAIKMDSAVCCIQATDTGRDIVCSDMAGGLHRYDLRTGARTQSYVGHVNSRTRLDFAIDPATQLLSAPGEDGICRVWDLNSGGRSLASFGPFGSVPARPGVCAVLRSDWGGRGLASVGAGPAASFALLAPGQDPDVHSLDFYSPIFIIP